MSRLCLFALLLLSVGYPVACRAYPGDPEGTLFLSRLSGEQYDSLGDNGTTYYAAFYDVSRHCELQLLVLSPSGASAGYALSPEHFHYSVNYHYELFPYSQLRPLVNVGFGLGPNFRSPPLVPETFGAFIGVDFGFQFYLDRFRFRVAHKSESFALRTRSAQVVSAMWLFALGYAL